MIARTLARVLGPAAALVILLVLAAPASATSISGTNTFTGASVFNNSDWNDAANWSQGEVPDGLDDVVIPLGKLVNLNAGAGGTAQTLNLAGQLTIDGGNTAGGRSLTLGTGTSTISGYLNVFNGAVLNLGSLTNWTGGNAGVGGTGGGTVNISAAGVLNIAGDVSSSNWVGGLWNNQGTINRTTTTGNASLNNWVENDGTINVNSGTLQLQQGDGPGTSSGAYNVAAGSTLRFYGYSNELTPTASIGGAGTVDVFGSTVAVAYGAAFNPGALSLNSAGKLQLDAMGTAGSLTVTNGTREGTGTLTVNGNMNVSGGSTVFLKGEGTTTVTGSSNIGTGNFDVNDGHTLNLGSTTTWDAGVIGLGGTGGATIAIGAGDVLNITGNVYATQWGNGLWKNQGTINRTTATGVASIDNAVENDGAINVSSGTLALQEGDGAGTSAGSYSAAAGAVLNFDGGTHDLTSGAVVNGAGTVRFGAGTTVVGAGATFNPATLDFYGGTLQLDAAGSTGAVIGTQGTRSGSGTLTINGNLSVAQLFTLQGAGTTTVGGTTTLTGTALNVHDGHTLNLGPTTNWSNGIVNAGGTGGATVNIGAGDVLNITGNINTQGSGGGHWNNQGTINRTTTTGSAIFFMPVTNSGTINVDTGTLTFDSGLTQTGGLTEIDAGAVLGGAVNLQGGTLKGAGTASGSVTNSGGTVAPGTSPGKLSIGGSYTQSAGTLQAEVAGAGQGTSYDWLAVAGNVAINGGTLAIVNDPQFDPASGDAFDVVTAGGSVSGSGFASLTGAQVGARTYSVYTTAGPPGKVRLAFATPPASSTAPSLPAATVHPGDTLSCSPGTWTGSPTTISYQWLRNGVPITGATSQDYTVTDADVVQSITCRVTASNDGGSTSADSNAVVPTASPTGGSDTPPPANHPNTPPPPPPTSSASSSSSSPPPPAAEQTVRGDEAFSQGTSNDLYLACTKLDLLLIDVLPSGSRKVTVTGTADLRLAGETAELLLDGKRVGSAIIGGDGSFGAKVAAPSAKRRATARYQARIGTTASQKLRLERRMVATTLTRSGSNLILRGTVTKPFASRPAAIQVERFLSCRQSEKVKVARVVPDRNGRFAVRIPLPPGARAAIYRALTMVPPRPSAAATARTFTLPRAIDL